MPDKPIETEPAPADEGVKRESDGRFRKGSSGGPGRRRMDPQVVEMLQAASPKAAKRLIEAMDAERTYVVGSGADAEAVAVPDHDMRTKAANAIFDRLYGRPAQEITGPDGEQLFNPLELVDALRRMSDG